MTGWANRKRGAIRRRGDASGASMVAKSVEYVSGW